MTTCNKWLMVYDHTDMFPDHPGCYYILGFILFVLNRLEEATVLLKMGRTIDPGFEPFNGK